MVARLRIVSGLILFAFAACHLATVALGIHSAQAIVDGSGWLMAPFFNPVGGPVVILALLVHTALGLQSIYRRNTFRMTGLDQAQFATSIIIIPALAPHVIGTAIAGRFYDIVPSFQALLHYFWVVNPAEGLRQVLVIVLVWIHGCIGVFTWLRLKPWWQGIAPAIYPLAVALPIAALIGFTEAGKVALAGQLPPIGFEQPPSDIPFEERLAALDRIKWWVIGIYGAILAATLAARWLRIRAYKATTLVDYGDGHAFSARTGPTLLELATINDIPHARLCRGRGRCGTCRVRVLETELPLAEPGEQELGTLRRIKAGDGVRLACQTRPPGGAVKVERLVAPDIVARDYHDKKREAQPQAGEAAA